MVAWIIKLSSLNLCLLFQFYQNTKKFEFEEVFIIILVWEKKPYILSYHISLTIFKYMECLKYSVVLYNS